jgi:hypothetical protein
MNDVYRELLTKAADEATRLAEVVDGLTERLAIAETQHGLVADWADSRIALVRSALQDEQFADVSGLRTELERTEAELAAVQELRRRLTGEHT